MRVEKEGKKEERERERGKRGTEREKLILAFFLSAFGAL